LVEDFLFETCCPIVRVKVAEDTAEGGGAGLPCEGAFAFERVRVERVDVLRGKVAWSD